MGAKNAKKHKFNAVDAVILAVLIAAIATSISSAKMPAVVREWREDC